MSNIEEVDPFDLPEWLGEGEVTWLSQDEDPGHRRGLIMGSADERLQLDVVAADRAYPQAFLPDIWRTHVHRAWEHNQVLLLEIDSRLMMLIPGTRVSADDVLGAMSRFARSIGAFPASFVVSIRAH